MARDLTEAILRGLKQQEIIRRTAYMLKMEIQYTRTRLRDHVGAKDGHYIVVEI